MAEKVSGKAFDVKIFKRLMSFAKRYKLMFTIAASSTILLAIFSVIRPLIFIDVVDQYIIKKDPEQLLTYVLIMFGILLGEVLLLSLIHI